MTENGWPTGTNPFTGTPPRTSARPRSSTSSSRPSAGELNITHYVLFGLRDAASSKPDLFHQFGIMRDDYTPKPAYTAFKRLVAEPATSQR